MEPFSETQQHLIVSFVEQVTQSDQHTFPNYVDTFSTLWSHEFGSLNNIPSIIDDTITKKAIELGIMDI